MTFEFGGAESAVNDATHIYSFDIEPRAAMNFAAAVGDGNERYFDDTATNNFVAHPMYAVVVTWPAFLALVASRPADLPANFFSRLLHFHERLEFSRPLVPGKRLRVESNWGRRFSVAAGTVLAIENKAYDQSDRLVFAEEAMALVRGWASPGAPPLDAPSLFARISEPAWEEQIPANPLLAHVYDGCSGISHPIHISLAAAQAAGMSSRVVHGTAILALVTKLLVNKECGGNPGRLKEIGCSFAGKMLPEYDLSLTLGYAGRGEGQFDLKAGDIPILSAGVARWSTDNE